MKDGTFTADRLLALYDRVAEAEDAIPRLRSFVLDLAVRGKLVEQDPTDEPAAELLKRIAEEKARLVKAGEVGPQRSAPAVDLDDLPFSLPSAWAWSQLAAIGIVSPRVRAEDDAPASFVPMSMIAAELRVPHTHEVRRWGEVKKGYTTFAEGDVGLAKITPCFENGKSTVFRQLTGGLGAGTTELHVVRPIFVDPAYILLFLKSPTFIERGIPRMTGTAGQKRVPTEYFSGSPFPLPPLAEQRRIVAKVDELMALCDRLEGARAGREAVRDRLTAATLTRLTAPETDAETFPTHARFALQTLPTLTTRPDQIKTLRQTILNLAVRGKLVAQDPTDEPAAELLKRIAAEKGRLFRLGETGPIKAAPELDDSDLPFLVPQGWAWAQLSSIGIISPRVRADDADVASFVSMSMISADFRVPHTHDVRRWGEIKKGYTTFADGDVGLAKITPCFENGKSTVFRGLTGGLGAGTTELHVVRPIFMNPDYILLFLKSPMFVEAGIPRMTGTAGQKRVPTEYFSASPFPLPPLAEQHRIVAKVDALMALCDQLEAALTTASTTRSRLLETTLRAALAGDQGAA